MSRRAATGVAGAVGLISVLTLLSRVFGFGRWLTQSAWVGTGAFANAYASANQLPTTLFEVVAGGALAGITIPLLAAPIAKGNKEEVSRTASSLICWSLLLLTPAGLLIYLFAPQIAGWFPTPLGASVSEQTHLLTTFLELFAAQVPLYGLCVVLTGVAQAHNRFLLPALGPLLNSVVVITTYAIFNQLAPHPEQAASVSNAAIYLLGVGTTLGVAAMSLPLLAPYFRLGLSFKPSLKLEKTLAKQALSLGSAGIVTLLAQQVSVMAVLIATRHFGDSSTLPVYQYSQAVYTLPYAVLAVPIATAMFPRLSARLQEETRAGFDSECVKSTRLVVTVGLFGSALLASQAAPAAAVFGLINPVPGMELALVCLALAVAGYGTIYHVTRVMYALGKTRQVAFVTTAAWTIVTVGSFALPPLVQGAFPGLGPGPATLVALGLSQSLGMTFGGIGLLVALRRHAGRAATHGILPSASISFALALVSAVIGFICAAWVVERGSGLTWALLGSGVGIVIVAATFIFPVIKQLKAAKA